MKDTLWQGFYTWPTEMESKHLDFSLSAFHLANVTIHVSSSFFKPSFKSRSKQNKFPKLLPWQLKVWQQSTPVQRCPSQGVYNRMSERVTVWEDKLYFSFSLLFPKPSKMALRMAEKKEVKLLKTWTSRLEVVECLTVWFIHLFQNASEIASVCLWLHFSCFTSSWKMVWMFRKEAKRLKTSIS